MHVSMMNMTNDFICTLVLRRVLASTGISLLGFASPLQCVGPNNPQVRAFARVVALCGGRLFPAFACHVVPCHFDDWQNSYLLLVSPLTMTHGRFQTRLSGCWMENWMEHVQPQMIDGDRLAPKQPIRVTAASKNKLVAERSIHVFVAPKPRLAQNEHAAAD